jgi:hypothetical protein
VAVAGRLRLAAGLHPPPCGAACRRRALALSRRVRLRVNLGRRDSRRLQWPAVPRPPGRRLFCSATQAKAVRPRRRSFFPWPEFSLSDKSYGMRLGPPGGCLGCGTGVPVCCSPGGSLNVPSGLRCVTLPACLRWASVGGLCSCCFFTVWLAPLFITMFRLFQAPPRGGVWCVGFSLPCA